MRFFEKKIFILFYIILLYSCEIDEKEKIPSYINIEKIELQTSHYQGTASENITDAWVSVNGNFIGVFELPAEFPVMETGEQKIVIKAGIKKNGISASRTIYPFYEAYEIEKVLETSKITKISPKISYKEETIFDWMEDFESAGISLDTVNSNSSLMEKIDSSVFEGQYSGFTRIKIEDSLFQFKTINKFEKPTNYSETYLEMNYKNNTEFVIGLIYETETSIKTIPVIYLNKKENWNKIYINLTQTFESYTEIKTYNLFFAYAKGEEDEIIEPKFYWDNFKLLHF
ncbi:MAG: hypothetical protein B6I24_00640 [Bacteroidetes bacterium 4572_128]|nr:MAG: hypothetical protein B6I24_00640 [Bacteroidetes bacterium 4572_128]